MSMDHFAKRSFVDINLVQVCLHRRRRRMGRDRIDVSTQEAQIASGRSPYGKMPRRSRLARSCGNLKTRVVLCAPYIQIHFAFFYYYFFLLLTSNSPLNFMIDFFFFYFSIWLFILKFTLIKFTSNRKSTKENNNCWFIFSD